MTTPVLFQLPRQTPLQLGQVVPGAKAQFFAAGTTTPQNVYTTPALTTAHSNPVVADSAGLLPTIYLDLSLSYRVQIKTSSDVLVLDQDDISGTQDEANNVRVFGAVGDGATDDATTIQLALDSIDEVFIPAGTWIVSQALQWNSYQKIRGAGIGRTILKLSEDADEDSNILEPKSKDGSIVNWDISELTLDGNFGRATVSGVGTDRPAASCLPTMGARYGEIRKVEAKDAVLHGIDVCNGGELEGGQRYYVTPTNDDDPQYYPDNYSEHVRVIDCIGDNCGDDAITVHYAQHFWIERCVGRNASHRHPTTGACNGIELDDGHRDGWVIDCLAHNVTRGFSSKTHPPQPTGDRVHFINCKAYQCNQGFYIHKSGSSEVGNDIILVNPMVWDPAEEVDQSEIELVGINVVNIPNVHIINPIIHAPAGTALPLDQAIWINTITARCVIRGGEIRNWPVGEDSDIDNAAVWASSSTEEFYVDGLIIENCGWKGILCTHSASGKIRIRNVDCIGEDIADSDAIRITGELGGGVDLEVSGVTATGYTNVTSYGSLDSVEGLMVSKSQVVQAPESETATGTFTASLYTLVTDIDSGDDPVSVTLPNGTFVGQRKIFTMSDATNSSTVSVTTHESSSPEVFTFAQTTDVLILEWTGALWYTVKNIGVAT